MNTTPHLVALPITSVDPGRAAVVEEDGRLPEEDGEAIEESTEEAGYQQVGQHPLGHQGQLLSCRRGVQNSWSVCMSGGGGV